MTQETGKEKKRAGRRPAASIDEQIAEAARRLEELREKKKAEDRATIEKNRKAIGDLIRSERLDGVDVEDWRRALPKLKALLGVAAEPEKAPQAAEKSAAAQENKAEVPA